MEKPTYINLYNYSETTGYYENVAVLLSGTFYTYSVSANKNETFIINEDMKNHEYFVIILKTQ